MRLHSLVPLAFAALPIALSAQTPAAKFVDSARTEIEAASMARDTARLSAAVILLDRALVAFPGDPYLQHYRGYAGYRQVVELMRSGRMNAAPPLLDRATADLEASSTKLQWPETYALLSTLTAFRLMLDPSQGMTLGPRSGELMAQASQLAPNNPRVLYMQALAAFNTPPEYGGSVDGARTLIMRSLEEFKKEKPAPLAPAWGLGEAAAFEKQIHKPVVEPSR